MPFHVPLNHKFGCVCLTNAAVDRALREPLDLGGGLWAIFGTPLELAPHWRNWLGSVKAQNFDRAGITLLGHRASDQPGILDDENELLVKDAFSLFLALLTCEIFHYEGGLILSGANNGGNTDIRNLSDLETHFIPNSVRPSRILEGTIRRAIPVASGIRAIHSNRFERLRRGFRAWHRGIQQDFGEDRLHQFVRAVEAVIKPEIGRSEKLFTHRCQIFAGTSAGARALFTDLYQLRSRTEHMNGIASGLAAYPPAEREAMGLRRAYQAQVLASHVFEQILTKPELMAIFDSDDHIDEFWIRRRMDQQQEAWGPAIDLEALADARLNRPPALNG
jgi:hypothetical protein